MNKYEGLCCPVCHGKLFEDDDIVVCPECGAPHHRDCYKFEGDCHFADKHNTDEQWSMPKTEQKQEQAEPETIKCKFCGNEMPKNNLFCPKCGNSAAQNGPVPPFTHINIGELGFDKDEDIEGFKAQEVAAFVGHNYLRYINIFKKMKLTKSKTGWNWLAFLFPEYWFFSRKCYKEGILASFLTILYTVILIISGVPMSVSSPESVMAIDNNIMIAVLCAAMVVLVIRAVIGIFADYIYKKKVFKGLAKLKEQGENDPFAIMQMGGVNLFAPMIAWFVIDMICLFIQVMLQ